MKKVLSTLLVCVLLVGCVFTLASCVFSLGPVTMISGKYELDAGIGGVTYEFGAFGKVTITAEAFGVSTSFEGEYKVDNEADEITFTFEDDKASEYSGTVSFASGKEDGVNFIRLGGVKYNKVK
ncbi:MAG: hypothetical protein E7673_01365 [Ruminococcaceae bacterium]|nr:hypothetical protein [Oscillospiraceae bacterium]